MTVCNAIIVPHPPIIIPAVGRGQERQVQATIDAYRAAAQRVRSWEPEVLIITSPHAVMYADYFHISPGKGAAGDMSAFGAPQTRLEAEYDTELRQEIIRQAEAAERCHVEVTTLLIPGENDSTEEIRDLARWLAGIGRDIPLHLSRFFPRYKMRDRPPTPAASVYALAETAREHLTYVYTGNC